MCDDTIDPSLSPSHKQLLSNLLATITMHKRPVKLSAESSVIRSGVHTGLGSPTVDIQEVWRVVLKSFPSKPKTQTERCGVCIKQCGRPHEQLNPSKINKCLLTLANHSFV